jgi:hypothetical protein
MRTDTELMKPTTGVSTLERPTYSPGLLLEDEDLTAGVDYGRNLTRLLFRSLLGCGVICGLKLEPTPTCGGRKLAIKVMKGLGLDCDGNPIEVPKDVVIEYDPGCDPFPTHIWVVACHTSQPCRPREAAGCGCDDDGEMVKTRLRDGYRITLHGGEEPPADVCMCGGSHEDDCGCGCGCGSCILIGEVTLASERSSLGKADIGGPYYTNVRRLRPMLREECPSERVRNPHPDDLPVDDPIKEPPIKGDPPAKDDPRVPPHAEPPPLRDVKPPLTDRQKKDGYVRLSWLLERLKDPSLPPADVERYKGEVEYLAELGIT